MRRLILFVSCFLLLSGCGSGPADAPETPAEPPAAEAVPPEPAPETAADARAAYAAALTCLLEDYVLPDGTDVSQDFDGAHTPRDMETMAGNTFAVLDVDGDGAEELLVRYVTSSSAGSVGLVMDWQADTGELRTVLRPYPAGEELVFYDNGAVREGWSHNQGYGGRLWPYFLHVYDPQADSYRQVGAVDGWDSQLAPEDYPKEVDTSGSGMVYYIYEDLSTQWGTLDPVDESVYLDWLKSHLDGAAPLDIPWKSLTPEHIEGST